VDEYAMGSAYTREYHKTKFFSAGFAVDSPLKQKEK